MAFDAIPTNDWVANSLRQQLAVFTHNLVRAFQLCTDALPRPNTWKRTRGFVFPSLQTERFELIHQPARLVRPGGRSELRFAVSASTRRRIERSLERLERWAASPHPSGRGEGPHPRGSQ